MARPSKLTEASKARFLEAVRMGVTYELASRYAGFDDSTFRRYMADKRPEFQAFRAAVAAAEGEAAMAALQQINDATARDWRAAAWLLERRYPNDYGRHRVEVTGANGGPVQQFARVVEVVLLPAPIHDAAEWAASVAADRAKLDLAIEVR